jgi:hypothetical protein
MNNAAPLDSRQEIKYVAFHAHKDRFLSWLRFNRAGFSRSFPQRWINNIYFDTHDYNAFEDNVSGISARTKVRYRWYGNLEESTQGTIEIKRKRNVFGWKQLYAFENGPDITSKNWIQIYHLLYSGMPQEGKLWLLSNCAPVIINRYHREYFESRDGKVRINIDSRQSVFDQRSKPAPNILHKALLPDMIVIEAKFDRLHRDIASDYLQGVPVRVSRHSKYINAVNSVNGNGVWL